MIFSNNKTYAGFTLVETLVAVSILLVALVAPMTIASKGLQSSTFALEQNAAFFLAQEGIELVVAERNQTGLERESDGGTTKSTQWYLDLISGVTCGDPACVIGLDARMTDATDAIDCSTETDCVLNFDDSGGNVGVYHHGAAGTPSQFTRTISLIKTTAEVFVVSKVKWHSPLFGTTRTVELSTRLFDLYD